MNDLSSSSDPHVPTPVVQPVVSSVPSGNKEVAGGGINQQESLRDGTGQEFELPKEVVSAGVTMHPTVVAIPPNVSKMGVVPSGQNVPVQTAPTVVLPLTDDQIAAGLHESVMSSWRWLAEWCVRRLRQLHVAVKSVHGKLIRTQKT
jgi:hypothetical protein